MSFKENLDYQYKILILGASTVGKTSVLIRYIYNTFDPDSVATLGIDVKYKYIKMNNKKIRLDIWDTAGQDRFQNIAKNYFRNAHAVVFVFDVNKKITTEKLKFWLDNANEYVSKDIVKVLVGNKIDVEGKREVSTEQMKSLGHKYNMETFETSAKTGAGIPEIFTYLVTNLIKNPNIGIYIADDDSSRKNSHFLSKESFKEKNKTTEGCNC